MRDEDGLKDRKAVSSITAIIAILLITALAFVGILFEYPRAFPNRSSQTGSTTTTTQTLHAESLYNWGGYCQNGYESIGDIFCLKSTYTVERVTANSSFLLQQARVTFPLIYDSKSNQTIIPISPALTVRSYSCLETEIFSENSTQNVHVESTRHFSTVSEIYVKGIQWYNTIHQNDTLSIKYNVQGITVKYYVDAKLVLLVFYEQCSINSNVISINIIKT